MAARRAGRRNPTSVGSVLVVALGGLAVIAVASIGAGQTAEPEGVHVSFGHEPTQSATATWTGPPGAEAHVVYGPASGENSTAPASQERLPGTTRVVYEAKLSGLQAKTSYRYRAVIDGTESPVHRFWTPPPSGSAQNVTVTMFADHGVLSDGIGGAPSKAPLRVTNRTASLNATVHVVGGDLAYARGDPRVWEDYVREHEPLFAEVPTMTVPGPADRDPGTGWARYDALFPMPTPDEVGRWWSIRVGQVLLVGLNSDTACVEGQASSLYGPIATDCAVDREPAYRPNPRQRAFLEQTLASADEAGVNWTVVVSHYPPWSDGANHGSYENVRDFWGPLFDEHGVDLVLSGADHFYERTKPIVGEQPRENGTVYIVSGAGGNDLYPYEHGDPPDWEAARYNESYGTLQLTFSPDRLDGAFVTVDGDVPDRFTLENVNQGVRSIAGAATGNETATGPTSSQNASNQTQEPSQDGTPQGEPSPVPVPTLPGLLGVASLALLLPRRPLRGGKTDEPGRPRGESCDPPAPTPPVH